MYTVSSSFSSGFGGNPNLSLASTMGNCIRRRFHDSTPESEDVPEPPPSPVPDEKDREIDYLKLKVRSQEMEMALKDQEIMWLKEEANHWKELYYDKIYLA